MKIRKHVYLSAVCSFFLLLIAAMEEDYFFIEFKARMGEIDRKIAKEGFSDDDVLAWWKCADVMVQHFFNDFLGGQSPEKRFGDGKNISVKKYQIIPNIDFFFGRDGDHYLNYDGIYPHQDNLYAPFDIKIIPLDPARKIYFLQYNKILNSLPISTFHIMEINKKNDKYEITGKQEESNFFKKYALTGKLKFWPPWQEADPIPPFLVSGGSLVRESIKQEADMIRFDTSWGRCRKGGPCYDDMTISWVYANKRLHATGFVDRYESGWNEEKRLYEYAEEKVELAP